MAVLGRLNVQAGSCIIRTMRITKVELAADRVKDVGLRPVSMKKLGSEIFLAGRNGAGKTRLLQLIAREAAAFNNFCQGFHSFLEPYVAKSIKSSQDLENLASKNEITQFPQIITPLKIYIDSFEAHAQQPITLDEFTKGLLPINFVPTSAALLDPDSKSNNEVRKLSDRASTPGVHHLPSSCLAKIRTIQNQWFQATHPNWKSASEVRERYTREYEQLQELIQIILGTELGLDDHSRPTLFGRPAADAKLSDGQVILLQFAVALQAQGRSLADTIVFLDEPENHLHPTALRQFLDAIRARLSHGQIWVATHSVHVLAQADPADIWYMEDGEVRYAGRTPERVLESLLGGDEEIGRLADFMLLPARLASIHFAAECLRPPSVVMTTAEDPQTNQIFRVLQTLRTDGRPLRILDFGAGKGRLLRTLAEVGALSNMTLREHIDYFAYDPGSDDAAACRAVLNECYGEERTRHFEEKSKLKTALDCQSIDAVVMCNVFHEIRPEEWFELFSPQDILRTLLREDGYLLIVEDQLMPTGEKAHQKGFLVLDELNIKRLFAITESDRGYRVDQRNDGRLKAHLIPAAYLARFTRDTMGAALEELKETAKEQVKRLREKDGTYRNGKLHALWTQQWVNAELALESLGHRHK